MSKEAFSLFKQAHGVLMDGNDQIPGIFCEELRNAYFGSGGGDLTIRKFIDLVECTHRALKQSSNSIQRLLDELVDMSTSILSVLNQLTQVYEELAKVHAHQVKKQLNNIMDDIGSIAKEARMVTVNARIVAAHAGDAGKEFTVVAKVLGDITVQIDELIKQAVMQSNV